MFTAQLTSAYILGATFAGITLVAIALYVVFAQRKKNRLKAEVLRKQRQSEIDSYNARLAAAQEVLDLRAKRNIELEAELEATQIALKECQEPVVAVEEELEELADETDNDVEETFIKENVEATIEEEIEVELEQVEVELEEPTTVTPVVEEPVQAPTYEAPVTTTDYTESSSINVSSDNTSDSSSSYYSGSSDTSDSGSWD